MQREVGTEASFACCAILFGHRRPLNVISAIFVQSTMHAAVEMDEDRRISRLLDQQLWSTRIYILRASQGGGARVPHMWRTGTRLPGPVPRRREDGLAATRAAHPPPV